LSCLQLEMANMRVERTFGWISHWGGVLRERAGRLDVATGRLACVASLLAAGALNNPS
jgi:putative transposase